MNDYNKNRQLIRSTGIVGIATLLSRITGFIRDLVIAYYFGTTPAMDAFFIAFRIPNLLRRLFAEGALTISFIPVFTEVLNRKGKKEAILLFRSTLTLLSIVLLIISIGGIYLAPMIVKLMAPGYSLENFNQRLAIDLTRWCIPYIFFVSLTALTAGVQNSLNIFFAPAFSPVLLNLAMIISPIILFHLADPPVLSLSWGVIIGGLTQLLFQIPYLHANGLYLIPTWRPWYPELKNILRLMAPASLGAAIYQITVLMNTILASWLPLGSISYLYYADRLIEFPLSIFTTAITTVILPTLSQQTANKDYRTLVQTIESSFRIIMFINFPAMIGLIILAFPLTKLFFFRGKFDINSTIFTATALWGYSVGLWAFAGSRAILTAFYALKDTKTPIKIACYSFIINILLSITLMKPLTHVGLALATSISSIINMILLLKSLRYRLNKFNIKNIYFSIIRISLASGIMGTATAFIAYIPNWELIGDNFCELARSITSILIGIIVYFISSWLLASPELKEIFKIIYRFEK